MVKLLSSIYRHSKLINLNKAHFYSSAIAPILKRNLGTTTKMFKSAVCNLQEASKDQVQEFLNSFDTVLTDCDGKFDFDLQPEELSSSIMPSETLIISKKNI